MQLPYPRPYYLCGRKTREGWGSCSSGKINARILEQAVLDTVIKRVLTPEYVLTLVKEVNASLAQDNADVDREIAGVERQLVDIENTKIEASARTAQTTGAPRSD